MEKEKISLFKLNKFIGAMIWLLFPVFIGIVMLYLIFISEESIGIVLVIISVIVFILLLIFFVFLLADATKTIIIDNEGIVVRNIIFIIYTSKWKEISDVYILDFPGANKYFVPRLAYGHGQLARAEINRDFKFPEKWIIIENGRRSPLHLKNDNTKLQFLLASMNANSTIKLKYNEDNLEKITKFFNRYLANVGKSTEIKKMSFNITSELAENVKMNEFYVFLHYSNLDEEILDKKKLDMLVFEPLDKFVLPKFHEIWLKKHNNNDVKSVEMK